MSRRQRVPVEPSPGDGESLLSPCRCAAKFRGMVVTASPLTVPAAGSLCCNESRSRESGGPASGCCKSRQRRAEFRRYCLVSLRLLRQTPAVSCPGHGDVASRDKCIDSVRPARSDCLSRCAPATGAPALRAPRHGRVLHELHATQLGRCIGRDKTLPLAARQPGASLAGPRDRALPSWPYGPGGPWRPKFWDQTQTWGLGPRPQFWVWSELSLWAGQRVGGSSQLPARSGPGSGAADI